MHIALILFFLANVILTYIFLQLMHLIVFFLNSYHLL